jgi:hypothetical protein
MRCCARLRFIIIAQLIEPGQHPSLLGASSSSQVTEIPQSHTLFLRNVLAISSLAVEVGLHNFFVLCHGQLWVA